MTISISYWVLIVWVHTVFNSPTGVPASVSNSISITRDFVSEKECKLVGNMLGGPKYSQSGEVLFQQFECKHVSMREYKKL